MKALALAALTTALMAAPAAAQDAGIEFGALDCAIDGGTGFIFGSTKDLRCTFTPADQDFEPESYVGVVSKYGLDIGSTKENADAMARAGRQHQHLCSRRPGWGLCRGQR
jgi:hypothetical protein